MDKRLTREELLQELDKYSWFQVHIHHTYSPNHSHFNGSNHQKLQDGMRNYHKNTLGWSDIGQHLSVFPDGISLTGRTWTRKPASIKNHNAVGVFAVEFIGNFDTGNDVLEGEQLATMLAILKYFVEKDMSVIFHRDYSSKTCPGTSLDKAKLIELALQEKPIEKPVEESDCVDEAWKLNLITVYERMSAEMADFKALIDSM